MSKAQAKVSVDADLLTSARALSVDLDRAAEAGIRRAVEDARREDLQAWLAHHRDAFQRNADRDRKDGLVNQSLRSF